jgi:two-component system, cell cycle response regulator DivK
VINTPSPTLDPECSMTRSPILVVDDNPTILRLFQIVLEASGHDVHVAESAEKALEVVRSVSPRLILMDVQLPGIDGLELTRRLKADSATEDIVVVGVSAYAMASDEQKAREAGCDDYLTKPVDVHALSAVVSKPSGG